MMTTPSPGPAPRDYAAEARARKAATAEALAIDEALISELVETFYARIREHDLLGPIFDRHIKDWPPHLARMKDFWSSIALESGRFQGNPMLKHIAIPGIGHEHFSAWLQLWDEVLSDVCARSDGAAFFSDRAGRIAESLQLGIAHHRDGFMRRPLEETSHAS